ncbi:hypothetical protein [Frigoriglobus tundricola]|uniref:Uncharacterized protein n=1 Tax=Frigoriglobus tundricola TaxID=2774151 RepID=A0A6M5YLH2_9BACT|nr:hypothetical protein [Frigoriglobus tundricola]QJW94424.1 hypothetical protein FTUN_1944 [Frigoriglobus tundricola]
MVRFFSLLLASFGLVVTGHAADLPAGTWAVNVDGAKGELVIKDVKAGKVTGTLFDTEFTGTWNGKVLVFKSGDDGYEAHLVSEPGEKERAKYTLTGARVRATKGAPEPSKTGWYAQITADAPEPTGALKAEVRGVMVLDGTKAYVAVKRKTIFGTVEETRVWVYASEGEWKVLKFTLPPLNGKDVIVTAQLAQMDSDGASLPKGALYFLGTFDPKLAADTK